jgi:hypothetical protein
MARGALRVGRLLNFPDRRRRRDGPDCQTQAPTASPAGGLFSDLDSLAGLLRREVDLGMFELAQSDKGKRGGAHQS